ncbi:hypothetical protein NM208_g10981 [Fusarium decemcellulare]|uniref:Uncharacterized protein n=1 Tax=Fusarium decemcellulare TaxID=57161 RepID=A0ACC1RWD4_9HYPO|nr:hypothetical protein NM208_g10981 [Fusarium decemcellulare]
MSCEPQERAKHDPRQRPLHPLCTIRRIEHPPRSLSSPSSLPLSRIHIPCFFPKEGAVTNTTPPAPRPTPPRAIALPRVASPVEQQRPFRRRQRTRSRSRGPRLEMELEAARQADILSGLRNEVRVSSSDDEKDGAKTGA